jgi:hypothetical protein
MTKAAEALSFSCPKLPPITCAAHPLHRVCEIICMLYPNVDRLVVNGKKIFVKSPARVELFKNEAPYTSFPHNSSNLVGYHCVFF